MWICSTVKSWRSVRKCTFIVLQHNINSARFIGVRSFIVPIQHGNVCIAFMCSQLCEVIVKVLRAMGCPSPLQANQIQGSDFVACFPVVQWLIKKVLEHRKITGDYVRLSSETLFDRKYAPTFTRQLAAVAASPKDLLPTASTKSQSAGEAYVQQVEERYRPQRRYRRAPNLWKSAMSAEARVQSCLLEFGERTVLKAAAQEDGEESASQASKARSANEFERKFAALQRAAKAEEEEKRKAAVEREKGMMEHMLEAKSGVSGSSVVRNALAHS